MSTPSVYPLRLTAELDPRLSRGLWLIKWLLVIPHALVLFGLWIGVALSTVAAFFAILFTGRYPRRIFDFNVGVLRWSWRVAYYSYSALGTDQYPPFSLKENPSYPASLTIDYPASLSRGLVLVKWWLLAIPHFLILSFFGGGWALIAGSSGNGLWGTGLVEVLVLVAGVMLLFAGRYPKAVFDLLIGLNRWIYRVAAYTLLMTDKYPPFRLDMGGSEPSLSADAAPSPAPAA